VHVEIDALHPEPVREEALGVEPRSTAAPRLEVVGRSPKDLADRERPLGHVRR
jgi:hypothetical protein